MRVNELSVRTGAAKWSWSPEPGNNREPQLRRALVVRLYPSSVQGAALEAQAHTARALWNLLHEWYTWGERYRQASHACGDRPATSRRPHQPRPRYEWLAQLPAQATQQVLKQYLRAWRDYRRGLTKRPRFKRRGRQMTIGNSQAETLRVVRLDRRWAEVRIQLVGRVRFRWTGPLPGISRGCRGRITGARIVKNPLGWHISFRIEEPATLVQPTLARRSVWTAALSMPKAAELDGGGQCRNGVGIG